MGFIRASKTDAAIRCIAIAYAATHGLDSIGSQKWK